MVKKEWRKMKLIYWNETSKKAVWDLYDLLINDLKIEYKDIYIDTSFGKTHLIETGKIERSVLLVPSAIKNAPAYKSMNMMFPMIMYWITHKDSWFKKCILPMAITEDNITEDILATARCSIDNARIKAGMPSDEKIENMQKYKNPVFVIAAEKDCLFPGKYVIEKAMKAWKQAETYLLKERGHINLLTSDEKEMIKQFLFKG